MSEPTPNLAKVIGHDLVTVGRVPLLLLCLIFASAMAVVFATHHSRLAITDKDHALVKREKLDNEWRNLMLEETSLGDHSRVQDIAKQTLNMKRPDGDKEVVIKQFSR